MGIEKTIFGQNAFSKSCFPWSMLPEKPRHTSGFHKKVFMKRPTVHAGHHGGADQPSDCDDVGHLPKDTGLFPHQARPILSYRLNPMLSGSLGCPS